LKSLHIVLICYSVAYLRTYWLNPVAYNLLFSISERDTSSSSIHLKCHRSFVSKRGLWMRIHQFLGTFQMGRGSSKGLIWCADVSPNHRPLTSTEWRTNSMQGLSWSLQTALRRQPTERQVIELQATTTIR